MPCRVSAEISESYQSSAAEHLACTQQALAYLDDQILALDYELDGIDDALPADRDYIAGIVSEIVAQSAFADLVPPEIVGRRVRDVARVLADRKTADRLLQMGCEAAARAYYPPLVAPGEAIDRYNKQALGRQDAEIKGFIEEAIHHVAAQGDQPGQRLLISGAQGSGKTTKAGMAAVEHLQDGQVLWLTEPTNKKSREEVTKLRAYADQIGRKINVVGVYGYSAPDPEAGPKEMMCRRGKLASRMARAGFSVRQTMCANCPFAEICGTKKMLAEIEEAQSNGLPTIYVMAHDYLTLPHCPAPRPNILICDEDFELATEGSFDPVEVRRMLAKGSIPAGDVGAAAAEIEAALAAVDPVAELSAMGWDQVLGHLRLVRAGGLDGQRMKSIFDGAIKAVRRASLEAKVPAQTAATMRLIRDAVTPAEAVSFFDEIVDALTGDAPMHQLLAHGQEALFRRLRAMIKHINVIDSCQSITAGKGLDDEQCEQVLAMLPDKSVIRVKWLFKQIRREIEAGCAETRGAFTSVLLRDGSVRVWWLKPLNIAQRVPVLALDGTGIFERHAAKWGALLEQEHIRVERLAEVIQCPRTFSKQSMLGVKKNGTPLRPEEALARRRKVRQLIAREGGGDPMRALLVAPKKVKELLIEEQKIDELCLTGHFGLLRGLNEYEQCGVVIALGREQIGARAAADAARAYLATDPEPIADAEDYVDEVRFLRMRDGSVHPVTVQVHPDPRVQRIVVEAIREAELAQAIDRVRPIFNVRKIIILSPVVLDITVDRVFQNLDDVLAGGSRVELAAQQLGGRVLPLAPGEHVRLGLAETIDQAKGMLFRQANDDHLRQVLPGRYLSVVEYRPAAGARRGPKPRAVVGTDDGMPLRQVLEAAVGPVDDGYIILENLRLAA